MTDNLALAVEALLDALERYDREVPVQTRLTRQHDALLAAKFKVREELAVARLYRRDEESPEYVTKGYHEVDEFYQEEGERC